MRLDLFFFGFVQYRLAEEDAAVVAAEGYTLNEGDVLRYIADSTLIGSLF